MARPLAFDPDEKLHQAMMLFWQRGYEATSLKDLVETLDINRFSLYNTFGDKQSLFLKVVERYEQKVFGHLLSSLEGPEQGRDSLLQYFGALLAGLNEQSGVRGCFLQNTLLDGGVRDPRVRVRIQQVFSRLRAALLHQVKVALQRGEIDGLLPSMTSSAAPTPTPAETRAEAVADYLLLQVQGFIALAGLGLMMQANNALLVLRQQLADD
ncbi:MAG: TetR family transcriptional regulator [Cellvibrionaceae bacterium]|nr:TetR family transcriptional regulator [Cellvibrionaceae bacterium]|tara:strand:+ start:5785 stop:6417 length:633 start_codon:yes stop_codon:yes gene_type:complete